MNFTAVNTTEVVFARLAFIFMGKKAVDCGAGGNCLPRTLEVATGEERERQRLIVQLLRKESILPEAIATGLLRNQDGVPFETAQSYVQYISDSCTHLDEFELG